MRVESEDRRGEDCKASDNGEEAEVRVDSEILTDSGVAASERFLAGVTEEAREGGVVLTTGVKGDTEFDGAKTGDSLGAGVQGGFDLVKEVDTEASSESKGLFSGGNDDGI